MITFALGKLRISLTFGFFFILAITSLRGNSLGAQSLIFCILHEFGHLAAMKLFGAYAAEIKFYGAGISISSEDITCLSKSKRALVYLGGPAVNLMLALIFRDDMRLINFSLAFFNLLPISYFDGGQLFALAFGERSKICAVLSVLSYVILISTVAAALFLYGGAINPSSFMTVIFIAFSWILDR